MKLSIRQISLIVLLLFVLGALFGGLVYAITSRLGTPKSLSEFGSLIGAVSSVFSILGFAGLICGLVFQQIQSTRNAEALKLQAAAIQASEQHHLNGMKVDLVNQLTSRMVTINSYFKNTDLPNPYDNRKAKTKEAAILYEQKGTALMLHLNLLYIVYVNKSFLPPETEPTYKSWFSNVVLPWIKNDAEIYEIWKEAKEHGDLLGKDFFAWIAP